MLHSGSTAVSGTARGIPITSTSAVRDDDDDDDDEGDDDEDDDDDEGVII